MHRRRVPRDSKRPALVYHRAALTHPSQIVPLALAFGLALATMSLLVALLTLMLGELMLVVLVPRSSLFRESVDLRFDRMMRAAAGDACASLLAKMSDTHVRELIELEQLASEIRERGVAGSRGAPELAIERSVGIERLLVSYVRLAIAHRRSIESFRPERKAALDDEAALLAQVRVAPDAPAAEWMARRRAIVEKRRATWTRASDDRDAIAQELATIAGVLRWVHELCFVAPDDPGRQEIDETLASCVDALAEPARLEDDDPIDPNVLELVRDARITSPSTLGEPPLDRTAAWRPVDPALLAARPPMLEPPLKV
jgi:hypothetical protein